MLGDTGVGKTTLIIRFDTDSWNDVTATICPQMTSFKVVNNYNVTVGLNVWDTAGQERFSSITDFYLRGVNVALLCIECRPSSFDPNGTLKTWLGRVRSVISDAFIILVGTKSDLATEEEKAEVRRLANQQIEQDGDIYTYCETSSQTGAGVRELFGVVANLEVKAPMERDVKVTSGQRETTGRGCCQ